MDALDTLTRGNADFATHRFASGLRIIPSLKLFVIGCVDPRVDPAQVLGIDLGLAAVIRNIGGRVTAGVLKELALLRKLTQAAGGDFDQGWNFVVLQHTDCGILRMQVSVRGWPISSALMRTRWTPRRSPIPERPSRLTWQPCAMIRACPAGCGARATSTTSRPDVSTPRWLPSERLTTSGHRRNR